MSSSLANATLTVALAGNPNSGKTTIFNALTGLRQKTANYPGVTVEKKTGTLTLPASATQPARQVQVIDLPGTYSLISRSPDERVAMEVLRGLRRDTPAPDVVVVVVDASNLQRNLYLVSQLIELGRPLVVALNMMDIAERRGIHVSAEKLRQLLGVPVVPVVGHKRRGIEDLKSEISNARVAPLPNFPLPAAMKEELLLVGGGLAILDSEAASTATISPAHGPGYMESAGAVPPRAWICRGPDDRRRLDRYQAIAERLLIGDRADDVAELASREPVPHLLAHAVTRLGQLGIDPMQADVEAHYRWIEDVAHAATNSSMAVPAMPSQEEHGRDAHATVKLDYARARTLTDKVDAIFIHKFWGLLVFAAIMAVLFVSIFWLADPLMGAVESAVGWLGSLVNGFLPDGPIRDLWTDGIVAGVGAVVVFVPQIALLFLFLAVLEDSGYLARAAFLMDRLLGWCGLNGRAVWRKFVSDDDLGRLYWSARAFAFLSEYEGLGLTPLEALAAGVPPVLLDTPVARESCGEAALYTAPGDVAAVTVALEQLLYDESTRKRLLDAAPATLSKYTWPRAARDTLALLEKSASD